MKKWLKKIIIGDDFHYVLNDISMLDHEVRKVRKEIVDLRNELLLELVENKSLLKQILEKPILVNDIKNNLEVVKVEEEKPVIKRELPDIPDNGVKIVKPILTQEDVKELFEYRDGDLYWKVGKTKLGKKAGSNSKFKGKQIHYQYKFYTVSRLIFLMFKGYLPEKIVFKDGNALNTKIENLLEANASQVQIKSKLLSINNITGYRGVHFHKIKNKYGASISVNKKIIHIGYYDTPEEASKAYEEAKLKYHGTFLDKCKVTNG